MAGLAQAPPQPRTPTFRSTVDLLTIDASVRDKTRLPVPDLQASDFTVTIDGKPRRWCRRCSSRRTTSGRAPHERRRGADAAARLQRGRPSPAASSSSCLIPQSIEQGQEKALFETASRMLDGLSPGRRRRAARVAWAFHPVTRDHAAIAEALRRFSGRAPGSRGHGRWRGTCRSRLERTVARHSPGADTPSESCWIWRT